MHALTSLLETLAVFIIDTSNSAYTDKRYFTINFYGMDAIVAADSGQVVCDVPVGGVTGHFDSIFEHIWCESLIDLGDVIILVCKTSG